MSNSDSDVNKIVEDLVQSKIDAACKTKCELYFTGSKIQEFEVWAIPSARPIRANI